MRIFSIPRGWLLVPCALAAALALPHRAAAQQCTEQPCGPFDGTPPTVTVTPGNGANLGGGQTLVTVNWADNLGLDATSRSIIFDGVDVTSAFNWANLGYSVIPVTARSEGYVDVGPGSHTLSATICDLSNEGPFCGTATATWNGPAASVRVTAASAPLTVPAGDSAVARYRVVNTGTAKTQYALSATCTGALSGCAPSVTTANIAAGDSLIVDVSFAVTGAGSARLTAAAGAASAYADVSASVLAAADHGFPGDSVSLMRMEREHCFTMSMGPGIAWDCGSARIVHPLPGVRALNKERVPVLVYNHDHARPAPTVAGHITPLAGTTPDSIKATLTVNGTTWPGSWPGWASTQTRRIAIAFDASGLNTGVYPYTWVVTAHFNNGAPSQTLVSETRRMVIVNRIKSPFGKGWWLAGVERLEHLPGDTLKLWVGGDGSARLYRGPTTGPWTAQGLDRVETLKKVTGPTGAEEFERLLSGGAKVYFNTWGEHIRTVNTLGHVTTFTWTGPAIDDRRLASITLPATPDNPAPLQYTFEYNNNTLAGQIRRLSRVVSPGPVDYRYTQVITDGSARVTSIIDPDSGTVVFGYTSSPTIITHRTDRRGAVQRLTYTSNRFQGVYVRPHPDSAETRVLLTDPKSRGLRNTPSVRADSVLMIYDGARVDGGCDCVYWTVNRYGGPLSMRDPYGQVTTYQRGDPRWPGRVTRVTAPNGFTTTATYDGNGYLATTTAWNPYGDGRSATTTYEWDTRWDAATRVTLPEGETSQTQYDSLGRREWEQVGASLSRRTTYAYYPSTHPRAPGLVESVTAPAISGTPASVERFEYDARGNLSAVRDPAGVGPQMISDRLGRTLVTVSPINGASFKYDSVFYGIVDQVDSTVARSGSDRLVARNTYDREGNLLSVSRQSSPDPRNILAVVTSWEYDLMGRRTVEIATDGMRDSTYYDRAGNVTSVRTRRGHRIGMTYDASNRLTQRVLPEVRIPARQEGIARPTTSGLPTKYDPYPLHPNNPGGCTLFNAVTNPACDYVIPGDVVDFGYDYATGALTQANNRDAQVSRTYFPSGALKTETQRIRTVAETAAGGDFTQHAYELAFTYDRNGRRLTLQHPSQLAPAAGVPTRYGYDPVTGALSGVTDPLGNAFTYTFNVRGETESLVRPGGVVEHFRYDSIGRLTRNWMQGPGGTWLRDVSLGYDQRGKVLNSTDLYGGKEFMTATYSGLGHVRSTLSTTYGVDASVNRPVRYDDLSTNYTDPLGNLTSVENNSNFTYTDNGAAGSTQSWGGGTMAYQAGTARLLTRDTGTQLEETRYDQAGNIVFSTDRPTTSDIGQRQDRASYFDAEGRLRAADMRRQTAVVGYETPGNNASPYYLHFEEYRYDALGRRVWVRARRQCDNAPEELICSRSDLRRVVWDGDAELYEIQVPGQDGLTPAQLENDTQLVPNQGRYGGQDRNLHYGRVLYTYGTALDKPLSVVRMLYADMQGGTYSAWPAPFALIPHWNLRGQAQRGTFANGTSSLCRMEGTTQRCVVADWPQGWFPYRPSRQIPENWHGTLITEKQDASGLYFRRNRYYDPATGRFTQEDPIGLAGGLNAYGFAEGDPVTYSDPYGLSATCNPPTPECIVQRQLNDAWTWLSEKADDVRKVMVREGSIQLGMSFVGGPLLRVGGAALGRLVSIGPRTWRSTAGLIYGPGSKHGNRVRHVLEHAAADPTKTTHSVFVGGRNNVLPLIDEAWMKRGVPLANDPGVYVVNMGRAVGTAGEQNIRIVVRPNTAELITAYPTF